MRVFVLFGLCVAASVNAAVAAQIDWTQLVGAHAAVGAGFGNPENIMIENVVLHEGTLVATTYNDDTGMEVWISQTGLDWVRVHSGNIGSEPRIRRLVSFQGFLYAAPESAQPCLWRSTNGADWQPVNGPCVEPSSPSERVWSLRVFEGFLYATTEAMGGGEIWRTADGENWSIVVEGGEIGQDVIWNLEVFNGDLLVTNEGTGIWKSSDGINWIRVFAGYFPGGYCCIEALEPFQGWLYAGTSIDGLGGFNLWRSRDFINWTDLPNGPAFLLTSVGHVLYSTSHDWQVLASTNGINFEPDNDEQFGNPHNWFYDELTAIDGYLYAATRNLTEGAELWRRLLPPFTDGFESGDTSAWSGSS